MKTRFYAVAVGKDGTFGLFTQWSELLPLTTGVNGALQKAFTDRADAVKWLVEHCPQRLYPSLLQAASLITVSIVNQVAVARVNMGNELYLVANVARLEEYCKLHSITFKRDVSTVEWAVGNGHQAGA